MATINQRIIDKNVYTLQELSELMKGNPQDSFLIKGEMARVVSDWLEELHTAKVAVYEARVALAKTKGY